MHEEITFYLRITVRNERFYGEFPEIPYIVDMESLEFEPLIDSEPCYVCGGRGLLVNRNRDAYTCNVCRGVGRMPNVRNNKKFIGRFYCRTKKSATAEKT